MNSFEIYDIQEIELEDITTGDDTLMILDIQEIELEDVITFDDSDSEDIITLEDDWENVQSDD